MVELGLVAVVVRALMADPCEHCAKPRGTHEPDCPDYFAGNALLGVPPKPEPGDDESVDRGR